MSFRKFITLFALLCLFIVVIGCKGVNEVSPRCDVMLKDGWKFTREASDSAHLRDYDDSSWEKVTIPHDWAISGPFDRQNDMWMENGVEMPGRTGSLPWT